MIIKQQVVHIVKLEEIKDLIKIHLTNLMTIFSKIKPELIIKHILKVHQKKEKGMIL